MLKAAYTRGAREAFAKLGLASLSQPSLPPGIKTDGLPRPAKPPLAVPPAAPKPTKIAANVGMAMSTARHEGPGAVRGEPADGGQRSRSIIDRAFQRNEDDFATSSMPMPASGIPL